MLRRLQSQCALQNRLYTLSRVGLKALFVALHVPEAAVDDERAPWQFGRHHQGPNTFQFLLLGKKSISLFLDEYGCNGRGFALAPQCGQVGFFFLEGNSIDGRSPVRFPRFGKFAFELLAVPVFSR